MAKGIFTTKKTKRSCESYLAPILVQESSGSVQSLLSEKELQKVPKEGKLWSTVILGKAMKKLVNQEESANSNKNNMQKKLSAKVCAVKKRKNNDFAKYLAPLVLEESDYLEDLIVDHEQDFSESGHFLAEVMLGLNQKEFEDLVKDVPTEKKSKRSCESYLAPLLVQESSGSVQDLLSKKERQRVPKEGKFWSAVIFGEDVQKLVNQEISNSSSSDNNLQRKPSEEVML